MPGQFAANVASERADALAFGMYSLAKSGLIGILAGLVFAKVIADIDQLRSSLMAIKAVDMRKGMGVYYKDRLWVVHSATHVVKGKGRSYMQIEMKNVADGTIIRERFRTEEGLDPAYFDRKTMEYLYTDGANHVVMDGETYEQSEIPDEMLGDQRVYLTPNIKLEVSFVEGKIVSMELPNTVDLEVTDVPPAIKGATATNQLKDAICEGGARVRVPSFVENGTIIKVDTRSSEYLGRA